MNTRLPAYQHVEDLVNRGAFVIFAPLAPHGLVWVAAIPTARTERYPAMSFEAAAQCIGAISELRLHAAHAGLTLA